MNSHLRIAASVILCVTTCAVRGSEPATQPAADAKALAMQSYRAHIAAARSALLLDEPSAARGWLAAAPEACRGFEWRFLSALTDRSLGLFARAQDEVWQIAISPDGSQVAVATRESSIELFGRDGKCLRSLDAGTGGVYRVAFSPDGRLLAAGGSDRIVRVWNAQTGEQLHGFEGFKVPITGVAFTPDGTTLLACNYTPLDQPPHVDGTVKLWDVSTRKELGEIRGIGKKPLSGIALSPDGKRLITGSWNGELYLCDLDRRVVETMIQLPDEGPYNAVNAVAWSPDSKWIACGSKDDAARIYDAASHQLKYTLRHGGWVTAVAFSRDGKRLFTTSTDEQARVWDVETGSLLARLRGHDGAVTSVAVAADDTELITAGKDRQLLRFRSDGSTGDVLSWSGPPGTYGLSFTPDGGEVIVNGFDGTLRRYDSFTGKQLQQTAAHAESSNWSSMSADGTKVVTCSWDKTLRTWDGQSFQPKLTITLDPVAAYGCAISPDGKLLAGAFADKSARLFDASTGTMLHRLEGHTKPLHEVAFSPDSMLLASAATDGTVRIWAVADGSCRATLQGHTGSVEGVAFSPDGVQIATAAGDGTAALWIVATGERVWAKKVSTRGLQRIAWAADGLRLAVAGDALYLLDPATGDTTLRHSPRAGDIYNLCFSPDGTRLAMCSADGWIAVIDSLSIRDRQKNPPEGTR